MTIPIDVDYALAEVVSLRQRLANTEIELTHAAKTCAEQQWRAEQAQARLAAAEAALRKIADHAEESPAQAAFWARQALAEARHD